MTCHLPGGRGGRTAVGERFPSSAGRDGKDGHRHDWDFPDESGQLQHAVAPGSGLNSARQLWTQLPVPRVLTVCQGC